MENKIEEIIEELEMLCDESSVPKNVKEKFKEMIKYLNAEDDVSTKVNKALHELDEIGDDSNLQAYVRTQIWNVASMLEKAQE